MILASIGYSQKSDVRTEFSVMRKRAFPNKCPACFDSTMVASTLEPRATKGGRFGKKRTSAATVRLVGPDEIPAVRSSSGSGRMVTPAGMKAGQSAAFADTTANPTRLTQMARETDTNSIFVHLVSLRCPKLS